jgi:NitT/TauT family transport system substrate-binding protein
MMTKKILCTLIVLSLLTLVGCQSADQEASEVIRVGTWKTAQTIQPFLYSEWMEADVSVLSFTNPGDMKTALLAGSLDFCGTTLVTVITAASKGEPVMIVAGLSNRCSALVVGANSRIDTVLDLAGKKIAYVPGTMHHLLLLENLEQAGLDPQEDVELIRIDFFDMGQALAQGEIDAFYSGEPYPSIALIEGYGRILAYPDDQQGFGVINSAMLSTRELVVSNPEMLSEFQQAHREATLFLQNNPTIWRDTAAEFGTDEEVLELSLNNIDLFYQMDEEYLAQVQNLADRMLQQGMIERLPDIRSLFAPGLLPESE